ncbi:MAG: DEAD/DEAH box helicase family protein [Dermatophilaceae bacterium]
MSKATTLLFPRFHQWDAVTKLTEAVSIEGPGARYLIQHSAGSGKTNSIAWTAHRLARLQVNNEKVFDSVIVVTDRNVLDAQLQDAIKQIDATAQSGSGVLGHRRGHRHRRGPQAGRHVQVRAARQGAGQRQAHHRGHHPDVPVRDAGDPRERRIARQAASRSLLTRRTPPRRAAPLRNSRPCSQPTSMAAAEDGGEIDVEALLAAEASERASSAQHLLLRVHRHPEGEDTGVVRSGARMAENCRCPFHVYSMKQAIEEGYILDVLRGYHSFQMAFRVAGTADAEVEVDQAEATLRVKRWVKLNPQTIAQKSALIVEHFHENVAGLLEGHAKAMVVSDSRLAAVRYKREIDKYVAAKGYDIGTLVAFSGSISDAEYGIEDATEASHEPWRW